MKRKDIVKRVRELADEIDIETLADKIKKAKPGDTVIHPIKEKTMKKTYARARMIEHQKGENKGMLEFRFYDNKDKLIRQRWANGDMFRADCEKRAIKLNLDIEQELFDGTHPLLEGPKIIMPSDGKLKIH